MQKKYTCVKCGKKHIQYVMPEKCIKCGHTIFKKGK